MLNKLFISNRSKPRQRERTFSRGFFILKTYYSETIQDYKTKLSRLVSRGSFLKRQLQYEGITSITVGV